MTRLLTATVTTASILLAGCASAPAPAEPRTPVPSAEPSAKTATTLLPGMPPPIDPADVYAADRPGNLAAAAARAKPLVYVPNFGSDTLSVIDLRTYKVIRTVPAGHGPQHLVPSWDLRTLWINDNAGNTLIPIDPATGRLGRRVPVTDPYNLYFTPDGKFAMVMAESLRAIVFSDPHTMAPRHLLPVGCDGINHADFSADGRYFIATCEFSGDLVKIDTAAQRVVARLHLPGHAMPQDIKISPDGQTWYVADMQTSGLWIIDGDRLTVRTFLPTGDGAHGLYPSRDSRYLYVANRGAGSVSVLDFRTGKVVSTWQLPGHASPDMGGVSADGRVLWLSGRYDHEVYAIDTATGRLIARIPVGTEPHGLCVWPQPGRYSLGHTGILR
ncbi:SMP-30/gluconolactonase/LRE family protein [Actinoplanes subtropicus]|uniref:YVTN family beta-propeller repeat protein n=1 Tax=Actinoplanes subtropicus TaxID=543632 RepID=UPI0004C3AB58|nr:SMP-30/gluconolactonase/LRE family protein [Actinoplanes subtropicus]